MYMPRKKKIDIIQQLEEGKKLQEKGFDESSLRTKVEEEDNHESTNKDKEKPKTDDDNSVSDSEHIDNTDNQCSNPNTGTDMESTPLEEKIEKYKDFDFGTMYEKGQTIYYIKVNSIIGTKEFMELKVRTIYPRMLIACTEKAYTQCIGPDSQDYIFVDRYSASEFYDNLTVIGKTFQKDYLGDLDIKDVEEN